MATTDPGARPPEDWRDQPRPLEEPAFLGRPFHGTSRSTPNRPTRGLGLLIGLFALILMAALVYFSQGNVVGGLVAAGALLVVGAVAVFVVRGELRRVIKAGRR
jgi:hypothetical protein